MIVEPVREPDPWGADDDYYQTTKKSKAAGARDEQSYKVYYGARAAVLMSWNDSWDLDSIWLSRLTPNDLSVQIHQLHRDGSWNAVVTLRRKAIMMWWVTYNNLTRHTTVTSYRKTAEIVLNNDQEKEN